jgi:uncharacterized repeat protein (TIGR03803 family)
VAVNGPTYSLLYNFTGGTDGSFPQAGLTQGADGDFYGVTDSYGAPTIFRFSLTTGLTTLHTMVAAEGGRSHSRLVIGLDGALYGTSISSSVNSGSVWRITTDGVFSVLHIFNVADGRNPSAGLVQDSGGTFYGVTSSGGAYDRGTIYAITPAGALTIVYSFTGGADGNGPRGALVLGSDGSLYGVTEGGGTRNKGTVFRATTAGALTTLYSFAGAADGSSPVATLLLGADGNFYGTSAGGTMGRGTIFRITPAGALTTIYQLGPGDGSSPLSSLVQDSSGAIYGEAANTDPYPGSGNGTLFELTPNGTFVRLWAMVFSSGANPTGGLTIALDGNLYGTASSGVPPAVRGGLFSLTR